jgi:hypothetical protein
MNTYFTRYYRGVILNVKLLFLIILLISLFACEQKKKSIIHTPSSYDIIMFYVFTDGFSSINRCATGDNYPVLSFNQEIVGSSSKTYKVNNVNKGAKLVIINNSIDSKCDVRLSLYARVCDLLNNPIVDTNLIDKICDGLNSNLIIVSSFEKGKICFLNKDILSNFQNSFIFSISATKDFSGSEDCIYSVEVQQ